MEESFVDIMGEDGQNQGNLSPPQNLLAQALGINVNSFLEENPMSPNNNYPGSINHLGEEQQVFSDALMPNAISESQLVPFNGPSEPPGAINSNDGLDIEEGDVVSRSGQNDHREEYFISNPELQHGLNSDRSHFLGLEPMGSISNGSFHVPELQNSHELSAENHS